MSVKYWGVRGSLPHSPSPEKWVKDFEILMHDFFKKGHTHADQISEYLHALPISQVGGFGTATTCVQITSQKSQIIIDGGSGIRGISDQIMAEPRSSEIRNIHIFLTHFHWDHVLGFPFFTPFFLKGYRLNLYAVQPDLEENIRTVFRKPFFPVPFESLPAEINFIQLKPRTPLKIDDMTVTPYQLDHPDPCWGFRVECGHKTYSHCVDTEGTRVSREEMGPDLPLYQQVDLMYFDAQYTLPELVEKANWGHSAAQIGLEIAFRESIKYVIFAHHDPSASTDDINELIHQTREYYDRRLRAASQARQTLPKVRWRFAHEGLELNLADLSS